jgi:hypothetical protein
MTITTRIVEKYESVICVDAKVTKVNPPIEGCTGHVSCEYTAFGSGHNTDDYIDEYEGEYEYEDQDGNILSFPRL